MKLAQLIARLREAAYRFRDRHGDWRWIICAVRGHEYPVMLAPACCLYTCQRCGRELLGREITKEEFDKLAPMTDEMRETLDQYDDYLQEAKS